MTIYVNNKGQLIKANVCILRTKIIRFDRLETGIFSEKKGYRVSKIDKVER